MGDDLEVLPQQTLKKRGFGAGGLPRGGPRLADVDPGQIVQVLHNIVLNARQAMPNGGAVRIRAENILIGDLQNGIAAGRYVRISVRDNGCGIANDDLTKIFDPYFTTKPKGHGLGLATAHSIVLKHRGALVARSEPGAGATLIVDLPASDRTEDVHSSEGRATFTGSGRILVMDDEESIRNVLAKVLDRLGYEVEVAADGAEAVATYKAALTGGRRFSAVMLDLTVPGGVGGADAAAELRRIDPAVKAILSSGYAEGFEMAEYRQHGFDAVLPKPWTPSQVGEVIAKVLNL